MNELSFVCKEIRKELKISQLKLADMLNTNQTKISFIENGFEPPDHELTSHIYKIYRQTFSAKEN